jgi:hypothetical protein
MIDVIVRPLAEADVRDAARLIAERSAARSHRNVDSYNALR